MIPSTMPWLLDLGRLTVVVSILVLLAAVAQAMSGTVYWKRTAWQLSFLALGLMTALEFSGAGVEVVDRWFARPSPAFRESGLRIATPESPAGVATADVPSLEANLVLERKIAATNSSGPAPHSVGAPSRAPDSSLRIATIWAAGIWITGAVFLLVRFTARRILVKRALRPCRVLSPSELPASVGWMRESLGIRGGVRFIESARLASPAAFGVLNPTVALPGGFAANYESRHQLVMVAHELFHIASRDAAWQAWAEVQSALLWWHPLVWWARGRLRESCELAADESSRLVAGGPKSLAESLVLLGRRISAPALVGGLGMADLRFRSGLGRRVERLLRMTEMEFRLPDRGLLRFAQLLGLVVAAVVVLVGTAWAGPPRDAGNRPATGWFRSCWDQSPVSRFYAALLGSDWNPPVTSRLESDLVIDLRWHAESGTVTPITPAAVPMATIVQESPALPGTVEETDPAEIPATRAPSLELEPAVVNPPAGGELATRWFKIDLATFERNLTNTHKLVADPAATSSTAQVARTQDATGVERLIAFFKATGVDLAPPKAFFYNDRLGMLMARTTIAELDLIERTIQVLNMAPSQVEIEVKLCELSVDPNAWPTNSQLARIRGGSGADDGLIKGILTQADHRKLVQELEVTPGADVLSAPKVTTLSNRPTQIKVVDVRYVVTDLDIQTSDSQIDTTNAPPAAGDSGERITTLQPIAEPMELGPVIDILPYVAADGMSVHLSVTVSIKEFLGYDQSQEFETFIRHLKEDRRPAEPLSAKTPLPQFRVRQVSGSAVVWDGQTLVLTGGRARKEVKTMDRVPVLSSLPLAGRLFKKERLQTIEKDILILVTPRLIDPAGNPIHLARPASDP